MPNTLKGVILAVIALIAIIVLGFSLASISALVTSFLVGVVVGVILTLHGRSLRGKRR